MAEPKLRHLAPTAFPQLPIPVRQHLARHGCRIPQYPKSWKFFDDTINVFSGEFEKPGQKDWAAVCSTGSKSTLLVFWNGSVSSPAQLDLGPSNQYRIASTVPEETMRQRYGRDHDGIAITDDVDHTVVRYLERGKWIQLPGVPHEEHF